MTRVNCGNSEVPEVELENRIRVPPVEERGEWISLKVGPICVNSEFDSATISARFWSRNSWWMGGFYWDYVELLPGKNGLYGAENGLCNLL